MANKKGKSKSHKKHSKKKKEVERMYRGQVWSVDVIIGVVIFISILTVFYAILSESGEDVNALLRANADTVIIRFTQDPDLRVLEGNNKLNLSRLELVGNHSYERLKEKLGIQGEFCIYLEDEFGRLVTIGNKTGIGNPQLNISGTPCGQEV